MFKKVDTKLNAAEQEAAVLKFWKDNQIFKKSVEQGKGKVFTFYEGPPGMNGMPHIGHVFSRTVKDVFPRYKTMKGYRVIRKAGWDTHGLPVELQAEKELGLKDKTQVEEYGALKFIEKCKEIVTRYKQVWEDTTEKMGYWVDFDSAYMTCSDNYIESVWWSLKEMFDRGLIYKGNKIVQFCTRCGTSLSSHEVAQGYKTVKTNTLFVKFKVKDENDTYFVAWTTTPWTLPSNVALAVNPQADYCVVEHQGEKLIMAQALAAAVLPEGKVLKTYKGQELEGREYEPLFDYAVKNAGKKAWFVTCADFVTLTDGTGIVHIAPAFGEDDAQVGKKYNLPHVQFVDEQGKFTQETADLAGLSVKEANTAIAKNLKTRGLVLNQKELEHEYAHCWRCDTPLLNYARAGWFIEMSKFRESLTKNNNSVNWMPEHIREGRMGNFLNNVQDWNLSRERYWGTPLPIWTCKCGHAHAVSGREELAKLTGKPVTCELHKPWVDEITFNCSKCGGEMKRVSEVVDVWYDSGAMPFAQWHYPFENEELFKAQFPADFIAEGQDQTRGWFYTLQAINTVLFNKSPYKNVIINGIVLDEKGVKMSKSLGNTIAPEEITKLYGADAMRWSLIVSGQPWMSRNYSLNVVAEVVRKFFSTLWNTYAFFVLYANIDNFDPKKVSLNDCELSIMDRWILSKLNTLIKDADEHLNNYRMFEPAREIQDFVDDLSNWYVRRCRERFWTDGESADKTAAFNTLYHVLVILTKLTAPFTPFMAEEIYQNLVCGVDKSEVQSVHLAKFPEADNKYIDDSLEEGMVIIQKIVMLGRSVRNSANLKNRQPLARMLIHSVTPLKLNSSSLDIIKDELNIKQIEFVKEADKYLSFELKPQLKTLGPKYGALIGGIREYLSKCNSNELTSKLKSGQKSEFTINGTQVEIAQDDVLIYPVNKPGFAAETDLGFTVILDTVLTQELVMEGYAREIISKIQSMRKEAGFEVVDFIEIGFTADETLTKVFTSLKEMIAANTLAKDIRAEKIEGFSAQEDINGIKCTITIKKVS